MEVGAFSGKTVAFFPCAAYLRFDPYHNEDGVLRSKESK
jgi:hypothetical protein